MGFLQQLDPAPIQYRQLIAGQHNYQSSICGCLSIVFWVVIVFTFYYQLSLFMEGGNTFTYSLDKDKNITFEGFIGF